MFPALTGIRFPLALWVVVYHLSGPGHAWVALRGIPVLSTLISHAYAALGVFFAISGFLLASGYSHVEWSKSDLFRYCNARFARIYPLYFFSLAMIAPIIFQQIRTLDLGSLLDRAVILIDYGLLLQGWVKLPVNWNTPAWSLSCEVFFYACFPLLMYWLRRLPRRFEILLLLTFTVPLIVHLLTLPTAWKPLTYFGDFLVGMTVAFLYARIEGSVVMPLRGQWIAIPALVLGFAVLLFGDSAMRWIVMDESLRLLNGALLFGLVLGGGLLSRVLSNRFVLAGGKASFAIYILHIPLLWYFERYAIDRVLAPVLAGGIYLIAVVLMSLAVSRCIEYPANALLRAKLNSLIQQDQANEEKHYAGLVNSSRA